LVIAGQARAHERLQPNEQRLIAEARPGLKAKVHPDVFEAVSPPVLGSVKETSLH
jgi:hypothetical protein